MHPQEAGRVEPGWGDGRQGWMDMEWMEK